MPRGLCRRLLRVEYSEHVARMERTADALRTDPLLLLIWPCELAVRGEHEPGFCPRGASLQPFFTLARAMRADCLQKTSGSSSVRRLFSVFSSCSSSGEPNRFLYSHLSQ